MKPFKSTMFALNLMAACSAVTAGGMAELADEQLSEVRGQDGVYLNLKDFSLKSKEQYGFPALTLTYTMPYAGTNATTDPGDPFFKDPAKPVSYIEYSNISMSRTDNPDPFADPYQIQIETKVVPADIELVSTIAPTVVMPGTMEVIRLLNPKNLGAEQKWNMSYDWKVATDVSSSNPNGNVHEMGGHIVEGLVMYGGGLDLAPAWSYKNNLDVRGTAFGLDLNLEIAKIILRPRGVDSGTTGPELTYAGVKIGRALIDPGTGAYLGVNPDRTKAWTIADVIQQPGVITAITENGQSTLHMGIDWYRGKEVLDINGLPYDPRTENIGAFSIDKVTIRNGAGDLRDFGSMSVGGIQIRYLDVNFRNPY